ncbi:MAG: hypothetical protein ACMUIE_09015 [Thermoplasmatota archaeon]
MTIIVNKEDGSYQKFDRSKIVESLVAVGVDHKTAKKMAKEIHEHHGISEHEIKSKLFEMLDKLDPAIADRFYMTKKVHVRSDTMEVEGNALLSDFLMDYLDMRRGEKLDLFHLDKKCTLRAYPMRFEHDDHETVFLSHGDIHRMDIGKHDQVAICKHRER